ncbi:iron ABC transporter permease [Streptomyces albidoflavus]|uniref:Iron ABC transporter n=2 Tax=Streptomyces TaxID=1883 RepID=D6B0F0_9ACTN|nr:MULTISPECIES: iron ABC transporter permease [Streptomyces]BDH51386.1 iron ABC transporter [Streptomyces albus]AGI88707.1 ABC-type Fe3+-siderophore transport system, permease 2 component [Streptomyces albidoflavus]EFE83143.1 iron-hydroxamate transporter permease subunit [Streptomyces albidoflavus]KDR59441.1 iron ABC transporter [Streptomyces wadayamensis]KUL56473.1 iron ABC transporter [Streptomyces albidoflavus]
MSGGSVVLKAGPEPARVRPAGYVPVRVGPASLLVPVRAVATGAVLAGVLAVVCVAYLSVGESFVAPGSVVDVLLGRPSPDTLVVGELRLPRMVAGLYVGAAFGIAGALIQTVARNPLASPDLIGVSQGASAATVAALTFGVTSYTVLPWISVGGGLLAALLVHLFAWRGGLQATRFVLVGVGFAVALRALTTLFLTKGDQTVAQQAQVWMSGSLNGRAWPEAALVGWTLLAALPALVWAARAQRTVTLDDATATSLGARLGRARLGLVLVGVVLASVATGAAGPVDFVALLAPQIARRLARTAQIPLVCSALAGAVTVVAADLLARRLFAPTELPVGVLTAAVGAPYLIWLLVTRHGPRATGGTS